MLFTYSGGYMAGGTLPLPARGRVPGNVLLLVYYTVLYCTLIQRSRSRVLEICHFTDLLRQELEDMEVVSKLYCGDIALYT